MIVNKLEKGLSFAIFYDINDKLCSIQESSLATESGLWLGLDSKEEKRMLISQKTAKDLIPILKLFGETGEIA